jgi:hypothetical protein
MKTYIKKIALTFFILISTNCLIAQSSQDDVFKEFKSLYLEIKNFKNNSDFKKYGFTKSGPYSSWLIRVRNLKDHPNAKSLLSRGFVAGELEALGTAYVYSKGKETETTRFFNKIFSEAISN